MSAVGAQSRGLACLEACEGGEWDEVRVVFFLHFAVSLNVVWNQAALSFCYFLNKEHVEPE